MGSSKEVLAELFQLLRDDGALLPVWWEYRRWRIAQAIERHAWDLESIVRLLALLDLDATEFLAVTEREEIRVAKQSLGLLDRVLSRESATPIGLLHQPKLVRGILAEWLRLEIRFPTDERSLYAGLRDRLVQEADRREIDLRGAGI